VVYKKLQVTFLRFQEGKICIYVRKTAFILQLLRGSKGQWQWSSIIMEEFSSNTVQTLMKIKKYIWKQRQSQPLKKLYFFGKTMENA